MKLLDKIKNLFHKQELIPKQLKTISDLDIADSVWIKDSHNILHEGWVYDINKKRIIVITSDKNDILEFRFTITRPLSQIQLTQNNKTLYLNEPCNQEILFSSQ